VYFHQNPNLVEVDFPVLTQTGGYVYYHGNTSLETVKMPALQTVHDYLYLANNTALTHLEVCALTSILPGSGGMAPYYYIHGNTPAVDATDCFSLGAPSNLQLSGNAISENQAPGTVIGTLTADSNYPSGTMVFSLDELDLQTDNALFSIDGNQLRASGTFDYEAGNEYHVKVKATNQLGESISDTFTINVTDIAVEPVVTVEITDTNLDNIYYHKVSFQQPTKLVFTNLASVGGYVYFHQNVNLVEVDFPALVQTGNYFYAYGNQSLEKIDAPALQTVHDYLFVANHNALTELNVCALSQILPLNLETPYYYVSGNPSLDFNTTCLINTTLTYTPVEDIVVLPPPDTLIGTFSCDTTDPVTYFFVDENGDPTTNDNFVIVGNGLYLSHEYSYYTETDFQVNIGAIRVDANPGRMPGSVGGLNEKIEMSISVNIENALGVPKNGKDGFLPWHRTLRAIS